MLSALDFFIRKEIFSKCTANRISYTTGQIYSYQILMISKTDRQDKNSIFSSHITEKVKQSCLKQPTIHKQLKQSHDLILPTDKAQQATTLRFDEVLTKAKFLKP